MRVWRRTTWRAQKYQLDRNETKDTLGQYSNLKPSRTGLRQVSDRSQTARGGGGGSKSQVRGLRFDSSPWRPDSSVAAAVARSRKSEACDLSRKSEAPATRSFKLSTNYRLSSWRTGDPLLRAGPLTSPTPLITWSACAEGC